MRAFNLINPSTVEEAANALNKSGALPIAGGGDLLPALKDDIMPDYPKLVVNLMAIPELREIKISDGMLQIGATAILADIGQNELVLEHAAALAEAAAKCASPNLRESTTIAGNICQLPRCWYFRKLNNKFYCARKGGDKCFAIKGDNRYHSIFGGHVFDTGREKGVCIAVNQSECAPALLALNAVVITTKRCIPVNKFFTVKTMASTVLDKGELIIRFDIPVQEVKKSVYKRFAFRKSIDFPVVNLAISVSDKKSYKIFLGGVAPVPVEAIESEQLLNGKYITPELAKQAAEAAVAEAKPTEKNDYKIDLIKTLLERELVAL